MPSRGPWMPELEISPAKIKFVLRATFMFAGEIESSSTHGPHRRRKNAKSEAKMQVWQLHFRRPNSKFWLPQPFRRHQKDRFGTKIKVWGSSTAFIVTPTAALPNGANMSCTSHGNAPQSTMMTRQWTLNFVSKRQKNKSSPAVTAVSRDGFQAV